jgi:THO complex subunit 1
LRRLSRAEDTAFCGRVFIFLFQSFPLGDPSSVNRRGEFHVENVTDYEAIADNQPDGMEVDGQAEGEKQDSQQASKEIANEKDKPTDMNALYPMFWSLQQDFSQPLRLFESDNLAKFKDHLSATMTEFDKYKDEPKRNGAGDDAKKDLKRKRGEDGTEPEAAFNPKYLTSRDLFELEVGSSLTPGHVSCC